MAIKRPSPFQSCRRQRKSLKEFSCWSRLIADYLPHDVEWGTRCSRERVPFSREYHPHAIGDDEEILLDATLEIKKGDRFGFGANWTHFLSALDDQRIDAAVASLQEFLNVEDLKGQRFLDIGSGSGLFSLAARRLGATVHSFDFDPQSVACAEELKRRYFPDDELWHIEEGSVLHSDYLESLGTFDVVYSWGVLHHTGEMWVAIENAIGRVDEVDGKLFIAIYADQGWKSHLWWFIKIFYNRMPSVLRPIYVAAFSAVTQLLVLLKYTIKLKPMVAIAPFLGDRRERGMSAKYDRIDWYGGFPFEFATLETLVRYFKARGFFVLKTRKSVSNGCHELCLQRTSSAEG